MRGRPPVPSQQKAQVLLRDAWSKSGISVRSLARRCGLQGHAALSRFLAGKQTLSPELVLRMAAVVGIEGRAHERLVASLLPPGLRSSMATAKGLPPTTTTAQHPEPTPPGPLRDVRFFFHPKMPLLYEVLKVLGPVTARELVQSLHPAVGCDQEMAFDCLKALSEMGLVRESASRWSVIDRRQDIVIPSKHTPAVGKRIIRDTVAMQDRYIDLDSHSRMMRSIVLTVRIPPSGNPLAAVVPNILSFQDDLLAQQGEGDDAVVNVAVSAMQIGKR